MTDSPGSLQTLHRVRELQHDALEALEAPAPPAPGSCPGIVLVDGCGPSTEHCKGCRGDAQTARLTKLEGDLDATISLLRVERQVSADMAAARDAIRERFAKAIEQLRSAWTCDVDRFEKWLREWEEGALPPPRAQATEFV